jgi:hypothetical protein
LLGVNDKLVFVSSNATGNVGINSSAILNLFGTTIEQGSYTILENANVAQANILGKFGTVNYNGSAVDTNKISVVYGTDSITVNVLSTIPEPATIGMLGLGAIITVLIRRLKA